MYKIRCYKRNGNLDHEEYYQTLAKAELQRKEWGLSIGLEPEPSTKDFAYYPTIWKRAGRRWERLEGY